MANENRNLVLILLVLAMFTGMEIENFEGSTTVGLLLFLVLVFLLTRINFKDLSDFNSLENSKGYFFLGIFIVLADLYYNLRIGGELMTLDLMTIFLGFSLMGIHSRNTDIIRVSKFGICISSVFILLFLIFYSLFPLLNIDFLDKFDHYFILIPTVLILDLAGIPLDIIATETVRISGAEEMILTIGGPCSGLYSMFLLIGIVFGYSQINKMEFDRTLRMFGFCIAVAYVSNLFRVIVLYLTAYIYGPEVMMAVHIHIGWIIFAGVAALIMYFIDHQR